jgi:hypothetical protein
MIGPNVAAVVELWVFTNIGCPVADDCIFHATRPDTVGVPVGTHFRLIVSAAVKEAVFITSVAVVLVSDMVTVNEVGEPFFITVKARLFPVPGATWRETYRFDSVEVTGMGSAAALSGVVHETAVLLLPIIVKLVALAEGPSE